MSNDIAPETKGASDLGFAIDDLMRAFEAFKDTNDRRLDDIERRQSADVLTTEKLARIDRALDDNKRIVDELALKSARPEVFHAHLQRRFDRETGLHLIEFAS